jgi:hypothetical protein
MIDAELEKEAPDEKAETWAENFPWDETFEECEGGLRAKGTVMGAILDDLDATAKQMPTCFNYETTVVTSIVGSSACLGPLRDNHELNEHNRLWAQHLLQCPKCSRPEQPTVEEVAKQRASGLVKKN